MRGGDASIVLVGLTAALVGACAEHHMRAPVDDDAGRRSDAGRSIAGDSGGSGALDADSPRDSGGSLDAPPADGVMWFEAEDGVIEAPMMISMDALASGGMFVTVDPASASSTALPPPTGRVTIDFAVERAGDYRIWGRVIALHESADSFWVRMDHGDPFHQWNNIGPFYEWQWDDVHESSSGTGIDTPVTFTLSAGEHTLDFYYREVGAQLDRIAITDDPTFVPER